MACNRIERPTVAARKYMKGLPLAVLRIVSQFTYLAFRFAAFLVEISYGFFCLRRIG